VIILDTETTGRNDGLKLDEPIQIAVTDRLGDVLLDTRVRPTVTIDDEATAVHGYTAEMLAGAPSFAEVADELADLLRGSTVTIYNAAFDLRILVNAAHAAGVRLPAFDVRCAMLDYARLFGLPHPTRAGEAKWWTLSAAYEHQYGVDALTALDDAHDALTDCRLTSDVLSAMQDGGFRSCRDALILAVVKAELKTARTGKDYVRLETAGGQSINVFGSRYTWFVQNGVDVGRWALALAGQPTAYVHTLKQPFAVTARYQGEYLEVEAVHPGLIAEVLS